MALDLLELIEAKARAKRQAFKALVQEASRLRGPETAARIQAQLDAAALDLAMVGKGNAFRTAIAQELFSLIDALDELAPDA